MPGRNYSAWEIIASDFDACRSTEEKLSFLVRYLVLAPSSHNSQPWRVRIAGSAIFIAPEFSRALHAGDESSRQLYVSLGCALQNVLLAADYYGFDAHTRYFPKETPEEISVLFTERSGHQRPERHLARAIPNRRTNRSPYDPVLADSGIVQEIKGFADEHIRIDVVGSGKKKDDLADVVTAALVDAMDDPHFRAELSEYIFPNTTRSSVGMPMSGFGMPTILSFFAPYILRRWNLNRLSRSQDEALLKQHTPFFVIISTDSDDREDWVRAGAVFEHIALWAEERGISTAALAAGIEIGEHHASMQKILESKSRPQVFFRIGRARRTVPHSPRISASDILKTA